MNKKICVSIIIALIMIVTLATSVLAAYEDVTLVKVNVNVCTIKLGEDGEVIKQLISVDNEKKEVTLQIDVKNLKSKEEETKPTLEGYEKGQVSELGAVNVMTGIYTGRSPKDKYIVVDENSKDTVWWT